MMPQNRLGKLVNQAGGGTMDEAVHAAAANLEAIRSSVVGDIEARLQRIQAIGAGLPAGSLEELYALSNSVAGMAGTFGLGILGDVAFSLCELVDRMKQRGIACSPAITLHIDSLRLVRPGVPVDEQQGAAMVEALRRVVERL